MVEQSPCAASHLWGGELTANSDLDLYAEPKYLCPNGVVIHRPCSCAEAAIKILYKIMQDPWSCNPIFRILSLCVFLLSTLYLLCHHPHRTEHNQTHRSRQWVLLKKPCSCPAQVTRHNVWMYSIGCSAENICNIGGPPASSRATNISVVFLPNSATGYLGPLTWGCIGTTLILMVC